MPVPARSAFAFLCCLLATVAFSAPPGGHRDLGGRDLGRQPIPARPIEREEGPKDTKNKAYLVIPMTPEEKALLVKTAKAHKSSVEHWAKTALLASALRQQK
jgi:hypothetical protein